MQTVAPVFLRTGFTHLSPVASRRIPPTVAPASERGPTLVVPTVSAIDTNGR